MLKTVRLPMYDENGTELPGYLEVDVTFWLSSTAGLRSNLARVVEPEPQTAEQWRKEAMREVEEGWDSVLDKVMQEHRVAKQEVLGSFTPLQEAESTWRVLPNFPQYEINLLGDMRYTQNGAPMVPWCVVKGVKHYQLLGEDNRWYTYDATYLIDYVFPESTR